MGLSVNLVERILDRVENWHSSPEEASLSVSRTHVPTAAKGTLGLACQKGRILRDQHNRVFRAIGIFQRCFACVSMLRERDRCHLGLPSSRTNRRRSRVVNVVARFDRRCERLGVVSSEDWPSA